MLTRSTKLAANRLAATTLPVRSILQTHARTLAVAYFHASALQKSALPAPSIKVDMRRVNYDELATPHGSWQEFYDLRQKNNNAMLAVGTASLVLVILYIWIKDPFHWDKAKMPRKFMKNPPMFHIPTNAEARAFKLKGE